MDEVIRLIYDLEQPPGRQDRLDAEQWSDTPHHSLPYLWNLLVELVDEAGVTMDPELVRGTKDIAADDERYARFAQEVFAYTEAGLYPCLMPKVNAVMDEARAALSTGDYTEALKTLRIIRLDFVADPLNPLGLVDILVDTLALAYPNQTITKTENK